VIERRIIWLLAVLIGFGALLAVPIPRPAGNTEVAAIVWLTQESSEEQIPPDTPRAPEVPPDTRPILPRVAQMLFDELLQTQSLIQLANQNQATIGSHSRSLEIDLQGSIKGELKWLILFLTQGVCTSGAVSSH
jgi:hypothetical protein